MASRRFLWAIDVFSRAGVRARFQPFLNIAAPVADDARANAREFRAVMSAAANFDPLRRNREEIGELTGADQIIIRADFVCEFRGSPIQLMPH
jgi:hypothetical protein